MSRYARKRANAEQAARDHHPYGGRPPNELVQHGVPFRTREIVIFESINYGNTRCVVCKIWPPNLVTLRSFLDISIRKSGSAKRSRFRLEPGRVFEELGIRPRADSELRFGEKQLRRPRLRPLGLP